MAAILSGGVGLTLHGFSLAEGGFHRLTSTRQGGVGGTDFFDPK